MLNLNQSNVVTASELDYRFSDYDSKQEYPAPDGKRIVTCLYRAKAGEKPARPNSYMFIPDYIDIQMVADNLDTLGDYLVTFLQDIEDARVKEAHAGGSVGFGDSFFSIANIISYLENKGKGSRLSGEQIAAWYKAELAPALQEMYLEKIGSHDKATAIVEFIGKKLSSLASPKVIWNDDEKAKLLPLLEQVEDSMSNKLIARINRMNDAGEDLLDLL